MESPGYGPGRSERSRKEDLMILFVRIVLFFGTVTVKFSPRKRR
jgi:hypothetical protein